MAIDDVCNLCKMSPLFCLRCCLVPVWDTDLATEVRVLSTAAPGWNFASYAGAPRGAEGEGCPCSRRKSLTGLKPAVIPCNDRQRTT